MDSSLSSTPTEVAEEESFTPDDHFEIGAVSRLTGLSTHNLRVWERRHHVVKPVRTPSKRRLYTRDDVRKLGLLKALVDRGDSISQLASLEIEQLESRLGEVGTTSPGTCNGNGAVPARRDRRCRVAIAGHFVQNLFSQPGPLADEFRIVSEAATLEALEDSVAGTEVDVVILEEATLFEERIEAIQHLLSTAKASRAIVTYRFAPAAIIRRIESELPAIIVLRAPANTTEIRLACLSGLELSRADVAARSRSSAGATAAIEDIVPESDETIPERRYSDPELAAIARISSTVQCECPQHLANLLTGLVAFERYSEQCENRNEDDARLHAYLHLATARARSAMETALSRVLDAEDIDLGGGER